MCIRDSARAVPALSRKGAGAATCARGAAAGTRAGTGPHLGRYDALVSKTPAFAAYLADISTRADDVRKGRISRKDDNMLKITTDGRKV